MPFPPTPGTADETTYQHDWGFIVHPINNIIPNRRFTTAELANGDNTALAGEVVQHGPFIGLLETDVDGNLSEYRDLLLNCIAIVKKINSGGTDTIADGAYVTFVANPTATKNDLWAETATPATDDIHAIALEAAGDTDLYVMVLLLGIAPYQTAP